MANYTERKEFWKNVRLSDIPLSIRNSNYFNQMGLTTLGELVRLLVSEFLKQSGFGR